MKPNLSTWVLALGLALFPITPARGQYTNPFTGRTFNNPASSFLDTVILHNQQSMMLRNMVMGNLAVQRGLTRGGPRLSKAQKQQVDRFAKYGGTLFKPGKSPVPAKLAAAFIPEAGEQREDMTKLFEGLLKVYQDRSRQQNAPSNDLARTLSYALAVNYAYAREQEVSAAGLAAMRGKLRTTLLSNASFKKLSNAQKQEMNDTLVILAHFVALGYDHCKEKGDQDGMAAYKRLANFNLKTLLNVDPSRIRLEKEGLVVT